MMFHSVFKRAALIGALLVAVSAPAQAGEPLSAARLQAFYDGVNASYKAPYEAHLEQLKASFAPEYRAKVTSTINMPGSAPTATQSSVSYGELVKEARSGYDSMQSATMNTKLSNVVVAEDGRSAKLREETKIRRMSMESPEGTIYGDSTAVCDDDVVLTAEDKIVVKASVCTLTLTITPEKEI